MESGYDEDRFATPPDEDFMCTVCLCVVKNPQECSGCGKMFCKFCIDLVLKKKR